jgi:methylated-DNA-[protein]-cysteine S-methyltransferase/AraC family transcriptional regulator of adaptative response/methylated-DNA-[protein]-cysteine methyltransferase
MNLMIKTDALRTKMRRNSTKTTTDILSYAVADSDLGKVLVARSATGVCSILLGNDAEALRADLAGRFPRAALVESDAIVTGDMGKILRYMTKPSEGLDLTLDMRGTPFQRRVWEMLKTIPVGRTASYMELARWVGPPTNARAVASACAANPIALAIPCHRIVRSDGDLSGYRWGIERKRELIRQEAMA